MQVLSTESFFSLVSAAFFMLDLFAVNRSISERMKAVSVQQCFCTTHSSIDEYIDFL